MLLIETSQDPLNLKAALDRLPRGRTRPAGGGLGHPRADRNHPRRADDRGGGGDRRAVAPALGGDQLLHRPRPDDRARAGSRRAHAVRSSRWFPTPASPTARAATARAPRRWPAPWSASRPSGWVNLIGGCCGTGPEHIRRLRAVADRHARREPPSYDPARLAGGEVVELVQDPPPLLIGERTNVLGSRKFKNLVREGRFAEAAEIGRRQVRGRRRRAGRLPGRPREGREGRPRSRCSPSSAGPCVCRS